MVLLPLAILSLAALADPGPVRVRVGYFPNLTHAQALLGIGNGAFEKGLGKLATIEAKTFNAGPSAIEALFAGELDLAYLGANPAVNGFVRSKGEALRVVAGACSGGARLVVRSAAKIATAADFSGKKLATPQLGNTQDVAARTWLASHHLKSTDRGGDVDVLPVSNPDQLTLFLRGELDAAWAPEPWASRLIHEGGGRQFLDERALWPKGRFATVVIVARAGFLSTHPEVVKAWLATHVELTKWIVAHPKEAKVALNERLRRLTGKALAPAVIDDAFGAMEFTWDPDQAALEKAAGDAFALGFLGRAKPELKGLVETGLLNEVLR